MADIKDKLTDVAVEFGTAIGVLTVGVVGVKIAEFVIALL